jgi:hypothetical protein
VRPLPTASSSRQLRSDQFVVEAADRLQHLAESVFIIAAIDSSGTRQISM